MGDVQVLHEPGGRERLEVAVQRGEVRAGQAAAETAGELVGARGRIGGEQGLEHEPPGGGDAQASGAQRAEC